ncbi:hypothetical protein [Microbacterium trichothecenolyticum]|uniref:Lipoprotein n=1 Tax=Microbacterium trichothecenolyticum TaxID=69370 RepID=A0A0M2HKW6_MICTR|nr:hypothetical protein [Microbacterium trichothecenolyticum]KJL45017.1 hypothetical protein RS82_00527 [Microbacterium trichothecenolyticum]
MNQLVRNAVASTVVCVVFVLGGCSAGGAGETSGGSTSTPGAVEVKEELLTVDMRIARSLLDPDGTLTDDAIVAAASEKGFAAVVDGDVVVYTMTKPQRDEMLADMRSSAQTAVDEMIADDSNSVTGVEFDDTMTSFRVAVDATRFSQLESFLVLAFYLQGALYQQFAGVAQDNVDVKVDFVDDATGEVLHSGSYQEMQKNLGQQ